MIWQRFTARRASAAARIERWPAPGWASGRNERSPGATRARRMVIREPEAAWWAAQEARDAEERAGDAAVTVVVVGQSDTGDPAAVVRRLAELAMRDELLVVYAYEPLSRPGHHAVLDGLRGHLPRHHIVTMHLIRHDRAMRRDAVATLGRFLEDGSLPVVVMGVAGVREITAEISSCLRADRVLRILGTTTGADLHQVWRRPAPSVN